MAKKKVIVLGPLPGALPPGLTRKTSPTLTTSPSLTTKA